MTPQDFGSGMKILAGCLALTLAACGGSGSSGGGQVDAPTGTVTITTISNRPDLISGGDALVQLILPSGASADGLRVEIGGRDVTASFARQPGGEFTGLVEGLSLGANQLTARTDTAGPGRLAITNASAGGPVLSGPQPTPFFCATPTPQAATSSRPLTNASGLSTRATDAKCSINTEYLLYYRTTAANCSAVLPDPSPNTEDFLATSVPPPPPVPPNSCFKPYRAGSNPADLATTTTDAGVTLPYIVRVERGTTNRGIYDIAVLFDPTQPKWSGVAPQRQWNGKLQFQFGGGSGQSRRQARPAKSWTDDEALSRGFMVAANSMTDSQINSNRIVTAETVMMMKERIIERYGPIRYTLAVGGSGGAVNSNINASIAPGQIDGMIVRSTFGDAETTAIEVLDCVLLAYAYQEDAWLELMTATGRSPEAIAAKKAAINGHVDQTGCHGWFNTRSKESEEGNYLERSIGLIAGSDEANDAEQYSGVIREASTLTNNCELPLSLVYDRESNPDGVRCAAASWAESIWGLSGGNANQTRDNSGVQYGLDALRSGAITGEEFTLLNEIVGGVDRNGRLSTQRSEADTSALETAYRSGIVLDGRRLAGVAIIDLRGWDDSALIAPPGRTDPANGPTHFVWRSFSIRDRLDREYGDFRNQALWRFGRFGLTPPEGLDLEAFLAMDRWLTAIARDSSTRAVETKVRSARPSSTDDFCILSDDPTQARRVPSGPACDDDLFLRPYRSPRQVAGGPLSENILKCRLRPLDPVDYNGLLSSAQVARLRTVFPTGVCDWSAQGVGQQPAIGPLNFTSGPGGRQLGPPPVSARAS